MKKDNTLILQVSRFPDGSVYPTKNDVGSFIRFDFGPCGNALAKVLEVVGEYVTYQFPQEFDLTHIKEKLYEQNKKTVSIQSC